MAPQTNRQHILSLLGTRLPPELVAIIAEYWQLPANLSDFFKSRAAAIKKAASRSMPLHSLVLHSLIGHSIIPLSYDGNNLMTLHRLIWAPYSRGSSDASYKKGYAKHEYDDSIFQFNILHYL